MSNEIIEAYIPFEVCHPEKIHMEFSGTHISGIFLLLFVWWVVYETRLRFQLGIWVTEYKRTCGFPY